MLFWLHPIVQSLTILPALYVLWLGGKRFAFRHLGRQSAFNWRRHVQLGRLVVLAWALGGVGALAFTYATFGKVFTASAHFRIGMAILVLLLVAWWTGTRMDHHRGASHRLPVVHLINNVCLLILVGLQLISGLAIVRQALKP